MSSDLRSRGAGSSSSNSSSVPTQRAVGLSEVRELARLGRAALVIGRVAYDLTPFLPTHPGGADILFTHAGTVATHAFLAAHPFDIMRRTLSASQLDAMTLGSYADDTEESTQHTSQETHTRPSTELERAVSQAVPLSPSRSTTTGLAHTIASAPRAQQPYPIVVLRASVHLVLHVSRGILRTIFTLAPRPALHRSSLMLLLFSLVHVGGNIVFLFGREAFNTYYVLLTANPLIRLIEAYLLLSFLSHAVSGAYLTIKYRKLSPPQSASGKWSWSAYATQARLALTGCAILGFVAVHLRHFRFSAAAAAASTDAARDLYHEVLSVLRDRGTLSLYLLSTGLFGWHIWHGWDRAVTQFSGLDSDLAGAVRGIGRFLAAAVTLGFTAVAVTGHALGRAGLS